jgi:hypothetical protein
MPTTIQLTKVHVALEGLPPGVIFQGKGLMELEKNGHAKADADDGEEKGKKKPPKTKKGKYLPPEEEAKHRAHWMGRGKTRQLCIPSRMLYLSFCQGALDFKQANDKKKNMSALVASTVAFEQDKIPLGTSKFETLEEYVRIPPRTGAMVLIGRPLLPKWKVSFDLLVDDEMWDAAMLEEIIAHAGKVVGIGAWRPRLKGPYGKFVVGEFKIL